MTTTISQEQQVLLADIAEAEQQLKDLRVEQGEVNNKLAEIEGERQQFQLLDEICNSLEKLGELGAAPLFWGEDVEEVQSAQQLERARGNVAEFQQKVSVIDETKQALQKKIEQQEVRIEYMQDEFLAIQEREERAKYDFTITREARDIPYRAMVMPWTRRGEDENRFRKTLALVLLFTITFGFLIPLWELPVPDENEVVEIPEHLVKLIKKEKPKPKPKPPEKKKEDKKEKKETKDKPKPTPAETKAARKKAETSGVLAFKDTFSDLLEDDVDSKLGASAKLSNKGAVAKGDSSRNLIMSQAQDTSGGINTASLSRNVGGSAGSKMGTGVSFSRVESAIGTDMGDERPLSDGPGPSRTDEEIQIVFDRYKAALYRIYNRELRKNPTLKGKMVLRITIQPDGSVSMAKVESSDLDSAELSKKIVERVTKFNFGPKEGVPKTTILYPIDFLPAT